MNDQGERCSSATDTEYGKRLRYCVTLMKRAQNDTERITCLFMIPKIIKDTSDDDQLLWTTLSECVPSEFLKQLLISDQERLDETATVVLARLLSTDNATVTERYFSLFPLICQMLTKKDIDNEMSVSFFDDVSQCILKLTKENDPKSYQNLTNLLNDECMIRLMNKFPLKTIDFVFNLLKVLTKQQINNCAVEETFHKFIQCFVENIRNEKTMLHFELLDHVSENLQNAPDVLFKGEFNSPTWLFDLKLIVQGMLQSHLGDKERCTAFSTIAAMIKCYGHSWMCSDENFLQLSTSLACIEIRLSFDIPFNHTTESCPQHQSIAPCCDILVAVVRVLSEQVELDQPTIASQKLYQMNDTLLELIKFLLEYLNETASETNGIEAIPLTVAFSLYSFLNAYLEEGSELIDENLMQNSRNSLSRLQKLCETTVQGTEKPSVN